LCCTPPSPSPQYASFEEHGPPSPEQKVEVPEVVVHVTDPQTDEQHIGRVYGGGTQQSKHALASDAVNSAAIIRAVTQKRLFIRPPRQALTP